MDNTILLSWRVQNVLAIWVIVIALGLVLALGGQLFHRLTGTADKGG